MPFIAGGLALGGGALSGLGSFFGGNKQAKATRDAMNKYIAYRENQRNLFLGQPESTAIRKRLGEYTSGTSGYDPDTLEAMNQGTYEDYGKGLADVSRIGKASAVNPGGVYTPGRQDRTTRILGENLGTRRAEALRDTRIKNAQQGFSNQRFAVSALPTFLPGESSTPVFDPSVFLGANAQGPGLFESLASPIGQTLSSMGGQMFASKFPSYPPWYVPPVSPGAVQSSQLNPIASRGYNYIQENPYDTWANRGGGGSYGSRVWQ